ncbi:MAG: hypothetical protein K2H46_09895 [Muribaculaceae bacterium]|nr:hypothetical protein [Muribaculaceae bacterium]
MARKFSIYKGIPIGLIIKKDLSRKKVSQKVLADSIGMSYYCLNRSLNNKRLIKEDEARLIDEYFKYEDRFTLNMQSYLYNKNQSKEHGSFKNITPSVRSCVFWDIDVSSLDWVKYRDFIINRVLEYGNSEEYRSVMEYYNNL